MQVLEVNVRLHLGTTISVDNVHSCSTGVNMQNS